jgi:hypothetical protein
VLDGLVAHHADDVRAAAQRRRVQQFAGRQRMNASARPACLIDKTITGLRAA